MSDRVCFCLFSVVLVSMDVCSFFIWNPRGLNSLARRSVVSSLVRDHAASLVCLQECKIQLFTPQLVSETCGSACSEYVFSPSIGASDGLLLAWNPDVIYVSSSNCTRSFIVANCTNKISGLSWTMVNVYGPQDTTEKMQFLADLKLVVDNAPGPVAVMGDFNLILQAADKSTPNLHRGLMNAFRRFMNSAKLKDMYMHGRRYTWSNEQQQSTC